MIQTCLLTPNQGEIAEGYEDLLRSTSATSARPSRRLGRSAIPQKRGASESTNTIARTPPPPRLSSLPARLFLPSTRAIPRFLRDPPLKEISFRRIIVQVTNDFSVSFDEDEILEEDHILLASRTSSEKPKLTGNVLHDREIYRSSGWIGEGETKLARYVSHMFVTRLSAH